MEDELMPSSSQLLLVWAGKHLALNASTPVPFTTHKIQLMTSHRDILGGVLHPLCKVGGL